MTSILVTGANRGIGLCLCQQLKARGAKVIAVCRSPSAELNKLGVRVESGIDLQKDDSARELARKLDGARLDTLILNAGILRTDRLESVESASIREQIEVNALAPLRVVQALVGNLKRPGKIALITSRMGSLGDNSSGGYYGYRMSKAALNMAGISLAHDLRAREVAVTILHPGFVRTEMTGGNGQIEADESARMLLARIDALSLGTSGRFWHANGEELPW